MSEHDLEDSIRAFLRDNLTRGDDGAFAYASEEMDQPCWGCEISALAALWDSARQKIKQMPFSFVEVSIGLAGDDAGPSPACMETALHVLANMDHYAALVPDRVYAQYGFYALAIPPQEDGVCWEFCFLSDSGVDVVYRFEKSDLSSTDCRVECD